MFQSSWGFLIVQSFGPKCDRCARAHLVSQAISCSKTSSLPREVSVYRSFAFLLHLPAAPRRGRLNSAKIARGFEEGSTSGADSSSGSASEIVRKFLGQGPQECFETSRRSCQGATGSDRSAAKRRQVVRRGGPSGAEVDCPPNRSSHCLCSNGTSFSGLGNRVAKVAREGALQIQNRELQGSCKRQAVGMSTSRDRQGPRLKEDFVPRCDEYIRRWMRNRQADIQEATMAGYAHEVARLCHVMASAATRQPSMVSNAVLWRGKF